MRLKITVTAGETETTIMIEGELLSQGIPDLENACRSMDGAFTVDLSELVKADEEGIQALKNLRDGGARLVAVSPYIELLMKSGPPDGGARRQY